MKHLAAILVDVGDLVDASGPMTARPMARHSSASSADEFAWVSHSASQGRPVAYNGVVRVYHLDPPALDRLERSLRSELERRGDVAFAFLYGSALDTVGFRDVDVAVWMTPDAGPASDVDLAVTLSTVVGLPVDVRRINDAPTSFLYRVFRGRALMVRDEGLVADLIERTAREHLDIAPLSRRATIEAYAA